jgi:predicted  nucleic acid-binding Zn-ribbon protein
MVKSASNDLKNRLENTTRDADRLLAEFVEDMGRRIWPTIEPSVREVIDRDLKHLTGEMESVNGQIKLLMDAVDARKQVDSAMRGLLASSSRDIQSLGDSCSKLETKLSEEATFSRSLREDLSGRITQLFEDMADFKDRSKDVHESLGQDLVTAKLRIQNLQRQCWALLVLSLVSGGLAVALFLSKGS